MIQDLSPAILKSLKGLGNLNIQTDSSYNEISKINFHPSNNETAGISQPNITLVKKQRDASEDDSCDDLSLKFVHHAISGFNKARQRAPTGGDKDSCFSPIQ